MDFPYLIYAVVAQQLCLMQREWWQPSGLEGGVGASLPLFGSRSHTDFAAVWKVSLKARRREINVWLQIFPGEKAISSLCLVTAVEESTK